MPAVLEAAERDAVDADALRRQRVAHRHALVDHDHIRVLEHLHQVAAVRERDGVRRAPRGLDDCDALVDRSLHNLLVVGRHHGRKDREVDGEGLARRQVVVLLDLGAQVLGRALRERGDRAEPAGVRDRRCHLGVADVLPGAEAGQVRRTWRAGERGGGQASAGREQREHRERAQSGRSCSAASSEQSTAAAGRGASADSRGSIGSDTKRKKLARPLLRSPNSQWLRGWCGAPASPHTGSGARSRPGQ